MAQSLTYKEVKRMFEVEIDDRLVEIQSVRTGPEQGAPS
jgi:hypothetical protein